MSSVLPSADAVVSAQETHGNRTSCLELLIAACRNWFGSQYHLNLPAGSSSVDDETHLPFGNVAILWLYTGMSKSAMHEWPDSCIWRHLSDVQLNRHATLR